MINQNIIKISDDAKHIIKTCETRDPFRICKEIGVYVMESHFEDLKGMYSVRHRIRWAFIKDDMSPAMKKIVLAHELGHDQEHRALAKANSEGLREYTIYNITIPAEYEANIFAAEILLPDDDIFDMCYNGYDNMQIASSLDIDANLIGIKCDILRQRGHTLIPIEYRNNFLK